MCWIGKKYAYAIILIQEFYWNQKKIANVANYRQFYNTILLMLERFLTEKLPNVKTCPSIKRTAVWLLPAVTCVLGPGKA